MGKWKFTNLYSICDGTTNNLITQNSHNKIKDIGNSQGKHINNIIWNNWYNIIYYSYSIQKWNNLLKHLRLTFLKKNHNCPYLVIRKIQVLADIWTTSKSKMSSRNIDKKKLELKGVTQKQNQTYRYVALGLLMIF